MRHSSEARRSDKMLAVLTPQQRVLLRTKILDKALPEANGQWGINVNGGPKPLWIYPLHPYADFSDQGVQKALSLTAAQRGKVREILGDCPTGCIRNTPRN